MSDNPTLLKISQALGINRRDLFELARKGLVVEGDFTNLLGVAAVSSWSEGKEYITRELHRPTVALTEEGLYTVFCKARR